MPRATSSVSSGATFVTTTLEMIKARLNDASPDGAAARDAARAGLYDVLYAVVRLLAPFVPHVCEAVYQTLFRPREAADDVARAPWPSPGKAREDVAAKAAGDAAVAVLTAIRRWRTEQKLGGGKPLSFARVRAHPDVATALATAQDAVIAAGRLVELTVAPDDALDAGTVVVDEAAVAEPLA